MAGAVGIDAGGVVGRRDDRLVLGGLVVLGVLTFLPYAVHGGGFVLDDWFSLSRAHFDGAFGAAGPDQELARPGAWVVYALVFGSLASTGWGVPALLGSLHVLTGGALYLLLRRFIAVVPAAVTCGLWLVLPNHTSLEAWASAANIAFALLLLVVGLLVLTADDVDAVGIVAASLLARCRTRSCYEAVVLARGRGRRGPPVDPPRPPGLADQPRPGPGRRAGVGRGCSRTGIPAKKRQPLLEVANVVRRALRLGRSCPRGR